MKTFITLFAIACGTTAVHAQFKGVWKTPGGDFSATVLSSVPGFDAKKEGPKSFASRTEFVTAAQKALELGTPLNLMIICPEAEGTRSVMVRFASDNSDVYLRPVLKVSFSRN